MTLATTLGGRESLLPRPVLPLATGWRLVTFISPLAPGAGGFCCTVAPVAQGRSLRGSSGRAGFHTLAEGGAFC